MKMAKVLGMWLVSDMLIFFLLIVLLFLCCCATARDFITVDNRLGYGETLVSPGGRFELGFFNFSASANSSNRTYIGIWYGWDKGTRVWVANRSTPLVNHIDGAYFGIENGTLGILDSKGTSYWSMGNESSMSTNITAQLSDYGNLVLSEDKGGTMRVLWQSFDDPTDTFLPGMKRVEGLELVSWKGPDDPAVGNFTFKKDENGYAIQSRLGPHWSNGLFPPDYKVSNAINQLSPNASKILNNHSTSPSEYINTRLVMNISGEIQYWNWDGKISRWRLVWLEPRNNCGVLNACGKFAICTPVNDPMCSCLEEFRATSSIEWEAGNYSGGCVAKSTLCKRDKFFKVGHARLGNSERQINFISEAECKKKCGCKCQAYSYIAGTQKGRSSNRSGMCTIWAGDLINLQVQEEYTAVCDLFVRLQIPDIEVVGSGGSEPTSNDPSRRSSQLVLIVLITIISVSISTCAAAVYIWRKNVRRSEVGRNPVVHRFDSERHAKDLIETSEFNEEDKKGIDVSFFEFETILAATHNFSNENKLGQGGYGPVYKGTFPGGQEIAVKRLSSVSGQGLQEFKNEVVLIAKLQHRNLVKLWGYCVKGSEKILVYEYMPNRSLDAFIFDSELASSLNWEMRYNIILGIARGLLYLHQDSRLRIIHRDMKTSNILLDGEMNPKISDFGLARIFGGKQNEANTNRVVGTYGYMAPEYALDGFFSVKSDVFSFGVVMLEIISGKRTTGFYRSQETLSLLGYAWRFWEEGDELKLMDQTLVESCNRSEFMKCVHVGLLCVQEEANDRPDMAGVIMMLGSESASLPSPKQPAFIARAGPSSSGIASSSTGSITERTSVMTSGLVEGR